MGITELLALFKGVDAMVSGLGPGVVVAADTLATPSADALVGQHRVAGARPLSDGARTDIATGLPYAVGDVSSAGIVAGTLLECAAGASR